MSVRIKNDILYIFNPATGEDIDSIESTSLDKVDKIINFASEKARTYNQSSFYDRTKIINNFRKALVSNMDNFIDIICKETGKKYEEGLTEILTSVDYMKYATKIVSKALRPEKRKTGILFNKKASVHYEPYGVAGIISPWNYPLILTVTPISEAILAGNTVVLKPSEQTSLTVKLLKEVWNQSTKEPDLFQVIYGAGDVGNALVSSDKTDVICFTGSTQIGQKIAETCASLLKPVILELGGKDPLIVMKDANMNRAADAAIWGGMSNAGQTCTSVEKIYVEESKKANFIDLLKKRIDKLKTGPNQDDHIGAITVENSKNKIISQIEEAKKTSEVYEGSLDSNDKGWFIPPTLIIDPPKDSKVMLEETFGPVITIQSFENESDLFNKITQFNSYGLSASIFTKEQNKAREIAKNISTGAVNVNDVLTHYGVSDLPFGGVGKSGIGRVHGKEGLRSFSKIKSLLENRFSLGSELWWYHKKDLYIKLVKKFIKFYYK